MESVANRQPRQRASRRQLIAALCVIFFLSTRHPFHLVGRYGDQVPSRASGLNSVPQNAFLLQPSDSFYRKYNISTTPIVIEKYKLLFFCTEKTGSTVFKQLLRRMTGHDDYWRHGHGIPHNKFLSGLKVLTDYSLEEANEMITSDEWTRAMFVRDPKERVLSGYLMWRPFTHLRGLLKESVIAGKSSKGSSNRVQRQGARQVRSSDVVRANVSVDVDGARNRRVAVPRGRRATDTPQPPQSPRESLLGNCCKDRVKGNINHEISCVKHMLKFEGFLDMIEDPVNESKDDTGQGLVPPLHPRELVPHRRWNSQNNTHDETTMISNILRSSTACSDKHWSPITHWRMERKFYPKLTFIGHLESARWDTKILLDILHPKAWEKYGASGWGKYRNESMFYSSDTVRHAEKTEHHLLEHYTSREIEKRVEKLFEDDYENEFLDLERVPIGNAQSFYQKKFLEWYDAD